MNPSHGTSPRPPDRRARGASDESHPAVALFAAMVEAVKDGDFVQAKHWRGRLLHEYGWCCVPLGKQEGRR